MRGDLEDRLKRAQSASDKDDQSQKIIIGGAVILLIAFIAAAVAFTVFFVKAIDKFVEPDTGTEAESGSKRYSYSYTADSAAGSDSGGLASFFQSRAQASSETQNFKFGTVEGTTYYSSFSGVTFTAPSDWILSPNNGSTKTLGSLYNPKDFSASSADLSQSVIISYELMSTNSYSTLDDAMKSTFSLANSTNNTLVDDSVTDEFGGHSFKGLLYKKTMGDNYCYYNEVLFTIVDGYALKIQLQANTQSELTTIRSMFK